MTTTINNEHKELNFSSEREQSQACLNSAEHEKNQGRKVLNVPNLRFPEFQGEWARMRLDAFTERVMRKNKSNQSRLPLTISAQYGLVDQITFFNKVIASTDMSNYYLLKKGEFAYNKSYSSDYPWGAIKRLDNYEQGALSSLYICFAPQDNVVSDFILQYFESPKWHKGVSEIAVEGARNHGLLNVSVQDFFHTYHYVPKDKKEQIKISKLLMLLDERIATQNKIIDKLQSLIKGISSRIFTSIQGIEYRMGDIVTITNGNSNVQDAVTQSKDGLYPFFDRSEDIKYLPTFLFDKEAIIYPGEGTEFMPRYFKGKFALHQRCYAIFDFNEIIDARFLYFYLKTRNSYFVKNAVGSTVPSLRLDTFQKLKVIIPSKKIQHSVSLCLSSMEQKCNVEEKILHKLLKQKQYLLRQMFI